MTDVITIMDFVLNGIFTIILKDYFELFMKNRYSSIKLQYAVWIMYWIIDYMVTLRISLKVPYSLFFTIFNLIIVCKILYINPIKNILTALLLLECMGCVSEIAVNLFLNSASENRALGGVCSKILILILVRIIMLLKKQSNYEEVSLSFWMANISISLSSLYIVYNIYIEYLSKQGESNKLSMMVSFVLMLLINIISFKEFDKIAMDSEVYHTNILYEKQINFLIASETRRKDFTSEMEKKIHDFRNHLLCIKEYATKQQYDHILRYIEQLQGGSFEKVTLKSFSGNNLIDYIISEKERIANNSGIKFQTNISIPRNIQYSDFDICIILTNALDNAIEATQKWEIANEKIVYLNMRYIKSSLYIYICNPFIGNIKLSETGAIMSTKSDIRAHGIGISSIRKAVENYNGFVKISTNNNLFTMEILLYL